MNFIFDFGSFTDWIGIFLGIPAVVIAISSLIQLKKASIERARELKAFVEISKALSGTIDQMQLQLGEFERQTQLMLENNSLVREELETQKKAQRNLIMPKFKIKVYKTDEMNINNLNHYKSISITLENVGATVAWKGVDNAQDHPIFKRVIISREIEMGIPTGEAIELNCVLRDPIANSSNFPPFEIVMLFSDVEGNKYSQIFQKNDGSSQSSYGLSTPLFLPPTTE